MRNKGDWYYECHATIYNNPSHLQDFAYDFEATVSANSWEEAEPKFWKAVKKRTTWRISDEETVSRRPKDTLDYVYVYRTGVPRTCGHGDYLIYDSRNPDNEVPHPKLRRVDDVLSKEEREGWRKREIALRNLIKNFENVQQESQELKALIESYRFTEGVMFNYGFAWTKIHKFLDQMEDGHKILKQLNRTGYR